MRPIWNSTRSSRSFCRYATLTRRYVFSPKIACTLKALPMYFPERLVPKRSDMESWNEPPLGPPSFSRLKFRSRAMLFPVVKPCRRPPAGLPRASVANVKVGVIPCSSSQLRTPYRSLNRCWRDRISWNGVSVTVRVPAGTLGTTSWARAPPALQRSARMDGYAPPRDRHDHSSDSGAIAPARFPSMVCSGNHGASIFPLTWQKDEKVIRRARYVPCSFIYLAVTSDHLVIERFSAGWQHRA